MDSTVSCVLHPSESKLLRVSATSSAPAVLLATFRSPCTQFAGRLGISSFHNALFFVRSPNCAYSDFSIRCAFQRAAPHRLRLDLNQVESHLPATCQGRVERSPCEVFLRDKAEGESMRRHRSSHGRHFSPRSKPHRSATSGA